MSELPDESFDRFFDQEIANLNEQEAFETYRTWFRQNIVSVLDETEVPHYWHPDPATQEELCNRGIEEIAGLPVDFLSEEEYLHIRHKVDFIGIDEQTIVNRSAILYAALVSGRELEWVAGEKRRLQAEVAVHGLHSGWADALDYYFPGVPFNLDDPEDQALYDSVAADVASRKERPIPRAFTALLRSRVQDGYDVDAIQVIGESLGELQPLIHAAISARPGARPSAEAHIDTMLRGGIISDTEALQLRGLLDLTHSQANQPGQ